MQLKDTVEPMCSDNHLDRMKAEYWQAKIRIEGLRKALVKLDAGTLEYKIARSDISREQLKHMEEYLRCVAIRCEAMGIDLAEPFTEQ